MQLPPTATAAETAVLFVLEVIIFLLGGLLLLAGIVLAGSTATMVGRVPGYGLGLTLISLAGTTIVGASALHFHRRRLEDRRTEIGAIREEFKTIRAELDAIREELKQIKGQIQAIARLEEKRDDQLASRRNGHHN
jgi:hypothetical protein